ncbi:hypothetical protein [Micromonospora wenchangensis]|uniref:hypothetical protein n=1 Tax=Micromonospora wenchangensis TaxID=1185415 RepID=UPI00130447F5|nr:hypothetical protein [Micromonospora wenchangensis]
MPASRLARVAAHLLTAVRTCPLTHHQQDVIDAAAALVPRITAPATTPRPDHRPAW